MWEHTVCTLSGLLQDTQPLHSGALCWLALYHCKAVAGSPLQRSPQPARCLAPSTASSQTGRQLAASCEAHHNCPAGASMCVPGGSVPHPQLLLGQPLCTEP